MILTKSQSQFYDVEVDIDSINTFKNKRWEIKYNKEREEIYEKINIEETIKIWVLILNNLGLIVKIKIPIGYSIAAKRN